MQVEELFPEGTSGEQERESKPEQVSQSSTDISSSFPARLRGLSWALLRDAMQESESPAQQHSAGSCCCVINV